MRFTMRGATMLAAAATALSLALTGCGSSGSATTAPTTGGGTTAAGGGDAQGLTIYTGRDKDEVKWVVGEFEKANPQYKGKVKTIIAGAQDNLDRLRAEKGNPQAGFLWGGTQQQLEQAAAEGLLMKTTPTHGDKIKADYKDPGGAWYAEMLLPEVIIYNSNLLTPDQAPKDWADLADPKWKGKIVIRDVMASGTMRTIYSAMIYRDFATDGKPDKGYEFLKKLDANTVNYAANPDDMYTQLDQGVGTVTLWNLQDALIQPLKNGRPWKYVMPSSGAPVLVDGVGVVNNPQQSKAGTDFMNFVMEPKMQAKLAADYYQLPAIEVPANEQPAWMKDFKLVEQKIDWKVFAANQTEWMKYWSENIKRK